MTKYRLESTYQRLVRSNRLVQLERLLRIVLDHSAPELLVFWIIERNRRRNDYE